jgi:hypothetical protein
MTTFTVSLGFPAAEMVREELAKQAVFLAKDIADLRFSLNADCIQFEAPEERGLDLAYELQILANRIQRSLRGVERKVIFRSPATNDPNFADHVDTTGVHFLRTGQVALEGLPLQLFRYFDRLFEAFGQTWNAKPLLVRSKVALALVLADRRPLPSGYRDAIVAIPAEKGDPRTILTLPLPAGRKLDDAAITSDGRRIAYVVMESQSDVWMIENPLPSQGKNHP